MQYLGIDYGTPRLPELDTAFVPMGAWMRAYEASAKHPVKIAVETANGRIVTRQTALIADGAHEAALRHHQPPGFGPQLAAFATRGARRASALTCTTTSRPPSAR